MTDNDRLPRVDTDIGPRQLGEQRGRKIGIKGGYGFIYVDEDGSLIVVPWDEAVAEFGEP